MNSLIWMELPTFYSIMVQLVIALLGYFTVIYIVLNFLVRRAHIKAKLKAHEI